MIKYLRSQKGLSLIELLVVVAIIAIVAGIAVPSYYRLKPTIRINGAARQIVSDLMWAKMKAVSENNDYVITFGSGGPDLTNDRYYIYDDNDNDFGSVGSEDGELVLSGTIGTISGKYVGVKYGFVGGVRNISDDGNLVVGSTTVTFSSSIQTGNVRWFRFRPTGRPNKPGSIYIILENDMASERKDRMRAITVSTAGRVKIWSSYYGTQSAQWKWK